MKYSKRIVTLALAGAIVATAGAQSDAGNISVIVNGNPVQFAGQGPTMSQDRVLVPLRGVFESMGAHVDWDPGSQTVSARRGPTRVRLTIGQLTAAVNGQPTNLDQPAQIVNASTMVPLRFVSEALGGTVDWNGQSNTVSIQIGGYDIPPPQHHWDHDHPQPFNPPPGPGMPPPGPGMAPPPPPPIIVEVPTGMPMPPVLRVNTFVQASLSIDLDPRRNHAGDEVYANVNDRAAGLPPGTRMRGVVQRVGPRSGVNVKFNTLILPNGKSMPFNAEYTAVKGASHGATVGIHLKNEIRFHKK